MSNRVPTKYLMRDGKGYWRYQRRVPEACQKALVKKLWNLSLGRDKVVAEAKAHALRQEHDELIARLRDPDSADAARAELAGRRASKRFAHLERQGAPDRYFDPEASDEDNRLANLPPEQFFNEMWRRMPQVLESADQEEDPRRRYEQLATMQALAFGDHRRVDVSEDPALHRPPQHARPTGKVDGMLHDAHEAMLAATLEEMAPLPDQGPPEMRVSALMEEYIRFRRVRDNTARSYRQKARRLTTDLGDHPLPYYDHDRLQAWRDTLLDDPEVSDRSVVSYFAPLRSLWRWAGRNKRELRGIQFPDVELPSTDKTIEESRWQAFDDRQIKKVWELLNEAWGPKGNSRLSPRRRADFLMAVRVMLYTGLRPVEVFRLTAADIHDGVLHIRQTKTTGRKLPLTKHLSDLPDFLAGGGFEDARRSSTISVTLSDTFRRIIRPHFPNDRHVLYSLKDTLVERLQRQDASDDVIRGIIGHVSGQGKLRHYKTRLGDTAEGIEKMKAALDSIEYW